MTSARELLAAGGAATHDWEARWRFTYGVAIALADENDRILAYAHRLQTVLAREREKARRRRFSRRTGWSNKTLLNRSAGHLWWAGVERRRAASSPTEAVVRARRARDQLAWASAARIAAHAAGQGVP